MHVNPSQGVNGPRGPCGPPAPACGSSAPRHPCGGPFGSVSCGAIYPVKLPVSGSTRPNSAGRSPRRRRSRSARIRSADLAMVVSLSGEHGARKPFPRPEQPKGLVGPAGSGDAAPGWQAWRARRVRMADPRRGFLASAVSADRDALRRASLLSWPLGADDRRTVSRASRPRLRAGPIRMWSGPLFVKRSLAPRALRSFLPHISGFQHQSLFEQQSFYEQLIRPTYRRVIAGIGAKNALRSTREGRAQPQCIRATAPAPPTLPEPRRIVVT
jgi:hypothetical protein